MHEEPLSFYCVRCGTTCSAYSPEFLCAEVNQHYEYYHKEATNWNPTSIRFSLYYSGPDKVSAGERNRALHPETRSEYIQRYVNREEWGDAKSAPVLTEEDKKWLQINKIQW
jgi:hypothetical protein